MKKQIQYIRFFFLASFLIAGLTATANNNVMCSKTSETRETSQPFNETFTYSWPAEPGAVSYTVDMVNTLTQESYSWETSNTSITVFGLPNGTYELTVTARFADQSSSIIIDEMIIH